MNVILKMAAQNSPPNRLETHVTSLIGIVDGVIDKTTSLSWDCNKFGGTPDWMSSSVTQPLCRACRQSLTLISQLYCPLESSPYHRTMYVFTCMSSECRYKPVSFQVFRVQSLAETNQADQQQSSPCCQTHEPPNSTTGASSDWLVDTDWCDDADDWGDEGETGVGDVNHLPLSYAAALNASHHKSETTTVNTQTNNLTHRLQMSGLECNMEQLSLQTTKYLANSDGEMSRTDDVKPQMECSFHETDEDVPLFVSYYINVFDEPHQRVEETHTHELQLLKEYQQREGVSLEEWQEMSVGVSRGSVEVYEKTTAKHGDRVFQKFAKHIQLCPEQCIRYCHGGSPLLMTTPSPDQSSITACQYCGRHRQFEFQLMPALVPYLRTENQQAPCLEFGVVLVYTCSQSCWRTDQTEFYREELAIVQQDRDHSAIHQAQKYLLQQNRDGN